MDGKPINKFPFDDPKTDLKNTQISPFFSTNQSLLPIMMNRARPSSYQPFEISR